MHVIRNDDTDNFLYDESKLDILVTSYGHDKIKVSDMKKNLIFSMETIDDIKYAIVKVKGNEHTNVKWVGIFYIVNIM
jgi:hypothetical protein